MKLHIPRTKCIVQSWVQYTSVLYRVPMCHQEVFLMLLYLCQSVWDFDGNLIYRVVLIRLKNQFIFDLYITFWPKQFHLCTFNKVNILQMKEKFYIIKFESYLNSTTQLYDIILQLHTLVLE